jgi:hypothetical protein
MYPSFTRSSLLDNPPLLPESQCLTTLSQQPLTTTLLRRMHTSSVGIESVINVGQLKVPPLPVSVFVVVA